MAAPQCHARHPPMCLVLASEAEVHPCAAGEGLLGQCYSTWQCQEDSISHNFSAMSLTECCRHPWGHSWRHGSTAPCLACTHLPLTGGSKGPRRGRGEFRGVLGGTCQMMSPPHHRGWIARAVTCHVPAGSSRPAPWRWGRVPVLGWVPLPHL